MSEEYRQDEIAFQVLGLIFEDRRAHVSSVLLQIVKSNGFSVGEREIGGLTMEKIAERTGIPVDELRVFGREFARSAIAAPIMLGQAIQVSL